MNIEETDFRGNFATYKKHVLKYYISYEYKKKKKSHALRQSFLLNNERGKFS